MNFEVVCDTRNKYCMAKTSACSLKVRKTENPLGFFFFSLRILSHFAASTIMYALWIKRREAHTYVFVVYESWMLKDEISHLFINLKLGPFSGDNLSRQMTLFGVFLKAAWDVVQESLLEMFRLALFGVIHISQKTQLTFILPFPFSEPLKATPPYRHLAIWDANL